MGNKLLNQRPRGHQQIQHCDDDDDDDNDDDDDDNNNNNRCLKTEVQRETRKTKGSIAEKTKERWHGKRMHEQLPRNLDEKLVIIMKSHMAG